MCTVNYCPYIRETLLACTSELPKERFNAAKALVKEESYILGTGWSEWFRRQHQNIGNYRVFH